MGGNIVTSVISLVVLVIPSAMTPFVMAVLNVEYGYSYTAKNGLMQREFSDHQRSTMGSIVSLAISQISPRQFMPCYLVCRVILLSSGFIKPCSTPHRFHECRSPLGIDGRVSFTKAWLTSEHFVNHWAKKR